jgi:antitoxin VapB
LPKEFQFNAREVYIRKEGTDIILSPRPLDWNSYLTEGPIASESFMQEVEELPVQERVLAVRCMPSLRCSLVGIYTQYMPHLLLRYARYSCASGS